MPNRNQILTFLKKKRKKLDIWQTLSMIIIIPLRGLCKQNYVPAARMICLHHWHAWTHCGWRPSWSNYERWPWLWWIPHVAVISERWLSPIDSCGGSKTIGSSWRKPTVRGAFLERNKFNQPAFVKGLLWINPFSCSSCVAARLHRRL